MLMNIFRLTESMAADSFFFFYSLAWLTTTSSWDSFNLVFFKVLTRERINLSTEIYKELTIDVSLTPFFTF
jgi:hypothetical protein